jgi:hypothetical protein
MSVLERILESIEWIEFKQFLDLNVVQFEDLHLSRNASDLQVWTSCQNTGVVLITGNRTSGASSLENVINNHSDSESLPVITLGDPQRVIREPAYARQCVFSLVDLLERIDDLRGTARLFIP